MLSPSENTLMFSVFAGRFSCRFIGQLNLRALSQLLQEEALKEFLTLVSRYSLTLRSYSSRPRLVSGWSQEASQAAALRCFYCGNKEMFTCFTESVQMSVFISALCSQRMETAFEFWQKELVIAQHLFSFAYLLRSLFT